MNSDFELELEKFIDLLSQHSTGVLATSSKDYVTSRTMFFKNFNENIYVITNKGYFKTEQINKNKCVSFTINNISIEGKIEEVTHNSFKNYNELKVLYEELLKRVYSVKKEENLVLYKISPELVKIWTYEGSNVKRVFLYPQHKLVSKKTHIE